MKVHVLLFAALLVLNGSVLAEGGCPNGFTPHNNGQYVTCIPGGNDPAAQQQPQQPAQPQPPRPTGYWEKTWGAIAPSPKGGVLGTALGARSKKEAEKRALADCKAKGGRACEVEIAYHNQCAVMVTGKANYRLASAGSIAEASQLGIRTCQKWGDTNCRVYYSACTEPIFHRY